VLPALLAGPPCEHPASPTPSVLQVKGNSSDTKLLARSSSSAALRPPITQLQAPGVGGGANAAAVSPDGRHVAVACKDGVLRVYALPAGGLVGGFKVGHAGGMAGLRRPPPLGYSLTPPCTSGTGRCSLRISAPPGSENGGPPPTHLPFALQSYFGGLLCCSWSPDAQYVAAGGEDDLLALYGLHGAYRLHCLRSGWRALTTCMIPLSPFPHTHLYRLQSAAWWRTAKATAPGSAGWHSTLGERGPPPLPPP
jgi:hypothetical protein